MLSNYKFLSTTSLATDCRASIAIYQPSKGNIVFSKFGFCFQTYSTSGVTSVVQEAVSSKIERHNFCKNTNEHQPAKKIATHIRL